MVRFFISCLIYGKVWECEFAPKLNDDSAHDIWVARKLDGNSLWWFTVSEKTELYPHFTLVLSLQHVKLVNCTADLVLYLPLNKTILPKLLNCCNIQIYFRQIEYEPISVGFLMGRAFNRFSWVWNHRTAHSRCGTRQTAVPLLAQLPLQKIRRLSEDTFLTTMRMQCAGGHLFCK